MSTEEKAVPIDPEVTVSTEEKAVPINPEVTVSTEEKAVPINPDLTVSTEKKVLPISPVDLDGDLDEFIVKQDFDEGLGIKTTQLTVALRKGGKTEWFMAHPTSKNKAYLLKVGKESGMAREETYILNAAAARVVLDLIQSAYLVLCENLVGAVFFCPLPVPDPGNPNSWHVSGLKALEVARQRPIRLLRNQAAGAYEVLTSEEDLPRPDFAKLDERALWKTLTARYGINSPEHEVLRRIRFGK